MKHFMVLSSTPALPFDGLFPKDFDTIAAQQRCDDKGGEEKLPCCQKKGTKKKHRGCPWKAAANGETDGDPATGGLYWGISGFMRHGLACSKGVYSRYGQRYAFTPSHGAMATLKL
jgi:hypothetical protein